MISVLKLVWKQLDIDYMYYIKHFLIFINIIYEYCLIGIVSIFYSSSKCMV